MLETMEIFHPIITEDTDTMGTRGCCQHCDEPLPHSRDSPNKEFDQSEDRKSSMTSNFCNWWPEFDNVWSEVRSLTAQYKGQQRLEIIHNIFLLRTNLWGSKVADPVISTYSWLDDLFLLRIDNLVDETVRKSVNFLSLDQKRYNKNLNSARQSDNSYYYRTESLHRLKILQDEDLQTSEELYYHSFKDSTFPPVEGAIGSNRVFQNALQALILQISLIPKTVLHCRHVVILMVILTQVDCKDVQVHINCTSAAVITSPNYPSTYSQYESIAWSVTAQEGRMILLTFNIFSLGPLGEFTVIDTVDGVERQRYNGEENTIPPFLSRRNSLRLRFTSDGTPTGNGFNISASCYDLSGTRVGRLVGGSTPAEGVIELQAKSGGEWMRMCGEHSADRVAEVVCRELGYWGAKEISYEEGGCYSEGADPGCIRALSCRNFAYRSQDCSTSSESCTSSQAVKVKCFEPGFKGCYELRNTELQNGSSYNSTSKCITSCRANTSQAIAIINGSECFCSTTDEIGLSSFSKMEARSCAPHQLVYNATVGLCSDLDDDFHGSWNSNITWFGSIVRLKCDAGYMLNRSGTLQCITKMPSYLPVWNGSIPTCEMITNTSHSMTSEKGNAAIAISSSMIALFTTLPICIICAAV
ncbi:CUB and sushi domain-containing protein 2 [Strongylocentrotus purpuratus]|uniref:Uncharacterized protein n=1 Tax=Strongylocentrotus purpuratus TaxID=7668 RepID=A0A7M7NPG7_STRPU|nr:CUB and sushi domain-containing protein 2 [Strongylocentrotus purpuratus]